MAQDGLEFVDVVCDRATRLPKPKNDLEATTRAMELSTIRQEIASMTFTKMNDRERTNRVLSRIGKGDLEGDLLMLEAVRRSTIIEPDKEAFKGAEKRFIAAYYPWIGDLKRSKESIDHWVKNRVTYQALPALDGVLPMGLTPKMILEQTAKEKPKTNLTERMKNAA